MASLSKHFFNGLLDRCGLQIVENNTLLSRRLHEPAQPRGWIWLPICVFLSLLLFLPLLLSDPPFLCDDYSIISTLIEDGRLDLDRMLSHFCITHHGLSGRYYRPVFYLSYAFDFMMGGTNPTIYYVMNCVYHGLAAWFLLIFLRGLGAGRTWSLFAMLLFLCHPIHIEAVAWIAGRTSSLAGMFYLASLACFAVFRRRSGLFSLAGVALFTGLGLMTREEGIVLPLIMMAVDLFVRPGRPSREDGYSRRTMGHVLAPYAVLGIVAGAYWVARAAVLGEQTLGVSELLTDMFQQGRVGMVFASLSRYLTPFVAGVTGEPSAWLKLGIALPMIVLFLWGVARWREADVRGFWLMGAFLFCFASLPSLPILRVDENLMNSRCFYFPSAGLCILLAAGACSSRSPGRNADRLKWIGRVALFMVISSGGCLLLLNQRAVIEAGEVCKAFLFQIRASSTPVMVAPRMEYFPYADQDGDGIWNDEKAYFAPLAGSGIEETRDSEDAPVALLINAPRVVKGVYVFWGGLDKALLPIFGEPGVNLLYTEMFTPKEPEFAPEGSIMGSLIQEGIPVLKWDGRDLVRVFLEKGLDSSVAGQEFEKAKTLSPLGTPRLLNGSRFESKQFNPVLALPDSATQLETFQYRTLTVFGTNVIPAFPRREGGSLIFDPWNEPQAGSLFKSVNQLGSGVGAQRNPVHDFDHLACLLMIEALDGSAVVSRSSHVLYRIGFKE